MEMPELEYDYESYWKFLCKNDVEMPLCIAIVVVHAPYNSLLSNYCLDIYNEEVGEIEQLPLMPYDVKKLKEIGKYITFIQNRYFDSRDGGEIEYLVEAFSYIQETMELPDGFLDYYDKVQAEEMLKG